MKILGKIFSGLYASIFCVILCGFMLVLFVGQLLNPTYYTNLVKDMDLSSYKIKDFEMFSEDSDYAEETTLEDYLILELVGAGISETQAKEIVNDDDLRKFLGDFLGNTVSGLMGGKIERVTIEEVKVAFKKFNLDEDFYTNLTNDINEYYDKTESEKISEDGVSEVLAFISGSGMHVALASFVAFSYLLIALLTWSFRKPFKYLGIPVILAGGFCLACRFSLNLISEVIFEDSSNFLSLITNNGSDFLIWGLLLIILGITMEVLYLVLKTKSLVNKTVKMFDKEKSSYEKEYVTHEKEDIPVSEYPEDEVIDEADEDVYEDVNSLEEVTPEDEESE